MSLFQTDLGLSIAATFSQLDEVINIIKYPVQVTHDSVGDVSTKMFIISNGACSFLPGWIQSGAPEIININIWVHAYW